LVAEGEEEEEEDDDEKVKVRSSDIFSRPY
jgi:hypothetical protein